MVILKKDFVHSFVLTLPFLFLTALSVFTCLVTFPIAGITAGNDMAECHKASNAWAIVYIISLGLIFALFTLSRSSNYILKIFVNLTYYAIVLYEFFYKYLFWGTYNGDYDEMGFLGYLSFIPIAAIVLLSPPYILTLTQNNIKNRGGLFIFLSAFIPTLVAVGIYAIPLIDPLYHYFYGNIEQDRMMVMRENISVVPGIFMTRGLQYDERCKCTRYFVAGDLTVNNRVDFPIHISLFSQNKNSNCYFLNFDDESLKPVSVTLEFVCYKDNSVDSSSLNQSPFTIRLNDTKHRSTKLEIMLSPRDFNRP